MIRYCKTAFAAASVVASAVMALAIMCVGVASAQVAPPPPAGDADASGPGAGVVIGDASLREGARDGRGAENNAAADEITPELDAAVTEGLAWLAQQQLEDGSWDAGRFGKNVAITSLACIAFMADGNVPGRGPYGGHVERGLDFVLDNATESGLIAAGDAHGPMYGHGFATLFLGEIEGMTRGGPTSTRASRTHEALVKAVRLIERSQNDEGGWRYNPVPYDADTSVTICQVMALRAARNAGIPVDKSVIDRAVEYVRLCQNPDGGFRYQSEGGSSAWPRSAAGIAALFYAGVYDDASIDRGLAYLNQAALPGTGRASRAHYFYGHYYAVQAMYLAGDDSWVMWWRAAREELLRAQLSGGSWEDSTVGANYGTSMALIVLQMPKRYLPIFQR
ncbi:MAG: prenyltransferase/squalene oxidase repeat-containing protein [Planctomycetota bacterium]